LVATGGFGTGENRGFSVEVLFDGSIESSEENPIF